MATIHAPGHDGLQVMDSSRSPQSYDDGMQYVPPSDKQVIPEEGGYHGQTEHGEKKDYNHDYTSKEKRYCGIKRRLFLILVAIILVVIIVAAVGGGVGGSMANKTAKTSSAADSSSATTTATGPVTTFTSSSSSSTASSTSLSSSAPAATATTVAANGMGAYAADCPSKNGTAYTSSLYPQTFEIVCDADWPNGVDGVNGGTVIDLDLGVIANSIQACIDQCAANNAGGGECSAVAYGANITLALSRGGITGNCFMKNQRGAETTEDDSGQNVAAFLISS